MVDLFSCHAVLGTHESSSADLNFSNPEEDASLSFWDIVIAAKETMSFTKGLGR